MIPYETETIVTMNRESARYLSNKIIDSEVTKSFVNHILGIYDALELNKLNLEYDHRLQTVATLTINFNNMTDGMFPKFHDAIKQDCDNFMNNLFIDLSKNGIELEHLTGEYNQGCERLNLNYKNGIEIVKRFRIKNNINNEYVIFKGFTWYNSEHSILSSI